METLQQVPLEIVPHWMNVFRTNEPMIIPDVDALKEQYEDEHQMLNGSIPDTLEWIIPKDIRMTRGICRLSPMRLLQS